MPTATSTLETIGTTIINTTVSFVTTLFSTYWPYILLAIALSGIVAVMYRLVHLGSGKGR